MKIDKIEEEKYDIYKVYYKPNWLERLFGIKAKTIKYKDSGREFVLGGGTVYIKEDGTKLGNFNSIGKTIDNFRRKF